MNGSVVADTATVGALVLPAMKKAGYPAAFSAAGYRCKLNHRRDNST
jgi:TRAP-type C4-dicarboxylate transport system permease large subunit